MLTREPSTLENCHKITSCVVVYTVYITLETERRLNVVRTRPNKPPIHKISQLTLSTKYSFLFVQFKKKYIGATSGITGDRTIDLTYLQLF